MSIETDGQALDELPNPANVQSQRQECSQHEESQESQPDGGYGWLCVAACFIFNAFTWGVVQVSLSQSEFKYFSFCTDTLTVLRRLFDLLSVQLYLSECV